MNTGLENLGFITVAIGYITMTVAAFRVSFAWGICALLLQPMQFVFFFVHFKKAYPAAIIYVIGCTLLCLA